MSVPGHEAIPAMGATRSSPDSPAAASSPPPTAAVTGASDSAGTPATPIERESAPAFAVDARPVATARWRAACLRAVGEGAIFSGLFAGPRDHGAIAVQAAFSQPSGMRVIECATVAGGRLDTLVDAVPAAAWDERELHDLHGVRFSGHEPLRPLVDHTAAPAGWTVSVEGRDTHQVAVGPIHAGVIESGHFRFHVVGERILHLDLRLFYKRRGLERAAVGRGVREAIVYVQRACAACAVANTVAYACACEMALGLEPDRDLRRARTLLIELERAYNHLHDIAAICSGVGFTPGTMGYAALKERVQRVNQRLAGHRFLFDTVAVGAGAFAPDPAVATAARAELRAVCAEHAATWRQLGFAGSLRERLDGVGVVAADDAKRLGATGPTARASGVSRDARADSPHLWYDDFRPVDPPLTTGDVAARTAIRAAELDQTFALIDALLADPPAAGGATPAGAAAPLGIGRVEGPRGATVCRVEHEGERVRALHLRTASYANWPVLAHAVAGELLPEFPLINKSFELCYACVDR